MYSIYKITNKINNKVYVGQTKQTPKYRFFDHLRTFKKGQLSHLKLYRAFAKYGIENFSFDVIFQFFEKQFIKEFEDGFIIEYNSILDGYNMIPGGTGGDIMTPKQRKLRSRSYTGDGNPMFDKHHNEESKSKISATRKEQFALNDPTYNVRPKCRPEKATKIKESNTGKKWVYNPDNPEERKQLDTEDCQKYLDLGWLFGTGPKKLPTKPTYKMCIHCGIVCQGGLYTRWHGDNCKFKKEK